MSSKANGIVSMDKMGDFVSPHIVEEKTWDHEKGLEHQFILKPLFEGKTVWKQCT